MYTGKYLITTDSWFVAPDGLQYRAVYGECKCFNDKDTLGISTNARSANWYVRVGSDESHIIIAGCQIHYAIKPFDRPNEDSTLDYNIVNGERIDTLIPCKIFFLE